MQRINNFTVKDNSEQFELFFCCILSNVFIYFFILFFIVIFIVFFVLTNSNTFYASISRGLFYIIKDVIKNNLAGCTFNWKVYLPFYYIIFLFILFSSVFGMLPFGYTVTSLLVIPFFFSIINFIFTFVLCLKKYKFLFFAGFLPSGTNVFIMPVLVIIEVISYFVKLFSLAIRLFANMFAGHVLVKVLLSIVVALYLNYTFIALAVALIVVFLIFAISVLEIFICCLQAYVFVNLASIYLAQVVGFIQH